MSRKFKAKTIDDLLGNNAKIIECRFGCGARIYRNNDLNVMLEEWTDRLHDRLRCEGIKEKARRDAMGEDLKAPRLEVVAEIRQTITKLPVGIEMKKQLYEIMKSRKEEDEAVTRDELAMALYPNLIEIRKDGRKRPNHQAITATTQLMSNLRKWKLNMSVVPFSKRFKNGQYYYYNMQTQDDFKPVKVRRDKMKQGIEEGTQKAIEIILSSDLQRDQREQELESYLKNEAELRRRRRRLLTK